MNSERAFILLENLLDRARQSSDRPFLTPGETEALAFVLKIKHQDLDHRPENQVEEPPKSRSDQIIHISAIDTDDIVEDTMLCLDFGTSYSKSFACIDTGNGIPKIIDLPIGLGGNSDNKLITPSEILIDNGTMYFGAAARKFFDDYEIGVDRLIDSIKQFMTLGADVSHLHGIPMDRAKDPDQTFSRRDILLLYLAHLMYLSETALQKRKISVNLRRRFTHPAWPNDKLEKNRNEMEILMAEAIVLSRSFGDRLAENISISEARQALDEISALADSLPRHLIADPVREATAAGAGALLGTEEHQRKTYIVVDIGAGTTDTTVCICVNNPEWDRARIFEVSSAAKAINSAGNVLDGALQKLMLEKCHVPPRTPEYQAVAADLQRKRRLYKELLFRSATGSVIANLPTGDSVEVTLEEFLEYEPVRRLWAAIKQLVVEAALAGAGDAELMTMVVTGGGAGLPVVREIAQEGVQANGKYVRLQLVEAMPKTIPETNPDLVESYPQLAVAVGGALPTLPEQKKNIPEGLTVPPPRHMGPMYKS